MHELFILRLFVSKASLRAKLILKCFVTRDSSVLCKALSVFVRSIIIIIIMKMYIVQKYTEKMKNKK